MLVTLLGIETEASLEQYAKALSLISLTLFGIENVVKLSQYQNVSLLITEIPSEILISYRPLHLSNAYSPISLTELGIEILCA